MYEHNKESSKSFIDNLTLLKEKAQEHSLSLEDILKIFAERGRPLLIILLSLPFCQPIQIPGFSAPFGLLIAFLGIRMCLQKKILLPKFLLKKHFSSSTLQKIANNTIKVLNRVKFLMRPRLIGLCSHPKMHILNGFIICLLGILLALPIPIPFTNIVFGWSIFLMALGILESDGLFVILGYVIFIAAMISFVFLFLFFNYSAHNIFK